MTNHETGNGPEEVEDKDDLVDEWGEDSFPASDPPGSLPPSLDSKRSPSGSREPEHDTGDDDAES